MKKFILSAALLLSMATLAACGSSSTAPTAKDQPKQDAAALAAEQVVSVGMHAEYPPFEKMEGDGKIVGYDIDIINAIANAEGMKIKLVNTGWDPLFEMIDKKQVDMGISAITIRDDRKKIYDFSDPYFTAKQLILVPKNSTIKILDDLKGKKVGVENSTTGETVVQQRLGKTYSGIKGYEEIPSAIDDLSNGRLDAVVADNAVVSEYAKKFGEDKFKTVDDPGIQPEYYGMMVKKGNTALLAKLNDGLKKIKSSGKYDEIYKKYFTN
jgi:ABC-type amino acid transport substrate-binding protein